MSRALKFHHRQRLKQNRRWYWGYDRDLRKEPKRLGKIINTPKPCSCLICGNERAHAGNTMQERKADLQLKEFNRCEAEESIEVITKHLSPPSSQDDLIGLIDNINQAIDVSERIRSNLYYKLSDQYREISGKLNHASDCAIHNAPAECPGPCDCDEVPRTKETPSIENGIHDLLTARSWLQESLENNGAVITGCGIGMGKADVVAEIEGIAFFITIQPRKTTLL